MSLDQHASDQHASDQHTTDQHANSTTPAEKPAGTDLSNQVFSDPKAFLAVLQHDFSQIESHHGKGMTQSDLSAYAKNGEDPLGRAAAQIAADHYSDLSSMSHGQYLLPERDTGKRPGITQKDLAMDQKLASGNMSKEISNAEYDKLPLAVTGTVGAVAVGAISASTLDIPPLAAYGGAMAATLAGMAVAGAKAMYQAPGQIRAESQTAQAALSSWTGQNGRSAV